MLVKARYLRAIQKKPKPNASSRSNIPLIFAPENIRMDNLDVFKINLAIRVGRSVNKMIAFSQARSVKSSQRWDCFREMKIGNEEEGLEKLFG